MQHAQPIELREQACRLTQKMRIVLREKACAQYRWQFNDRTGRTAHGQNQGIGNLHLADLAALGFDKDRLRGIKAAERIG